MKVENKQIKQRFEALIDQGKTLKDNIGYGVESYHGEFLVDKDFTTEAYAWMTSCFNLAKFVTGEECFYFNQFSLYYRNFYNIPSVDDFHKTLGLTISLAVEWETGFLKDIKYVYIARTFDEFLNLAEEYLKNGQLIEPAILSTIVFEDTVKKIAEKNGVEVNKLSDRIVELRKLGVFNAIKAKRLDSYAVTRHKALHAEWNEIQSDDVYKLIEGVKELLADHIEPKTLMTKKKELDYSIAPF